MRGRGSRDLSKRALLGVAAAVALLAPSTSSAGASTFDRTFGGGHGIAIVGGKSDAEANLTGVALQRDGKLVAVGTQGRLGGPEPRDALVVRFNRDGTLDGPSARTTRARS